MASRPQRLKTYIIDHKHLSRSFKLELKDTMPYMVFRLANKITTWLTFLSLIFRFLFIAVLTCFKLCNVFHCQCSQSCLHLFVENYSVVLKIRFCSFALVCAIAMLHSVVFFGVIDIATIRGYSGKHYFC